MKRFWKGVLSAYLVTAFMAGFAMKAVIPALNPLGMTYAGLTYPIALTCVATGSACSAVPPQRYAKWLFSFPAQEKGSD